MKAPRKTSPGFTLLELLMVVAIMGIIMTMAVAAFIDMGRGAGLRATVLNVRSTMSHARQYAIAKRTKTYFVYGNADWERRKTGYYFFATNSGTGGTTNFSLIGSTNFAAEGILFASAARPPQILNSQPPVIVFDTDGSCVDDGQWGAVGSYKQSIVAVEALSDGSAIRPRGLGATTDVYRLTGRVKGSGWVNE